MRPASDKVARRVTAADSSRKLPFHTEVDKVAKRMKRSRASLLKRTRSPVSVTRRARKDLPAPVGPINSMGAFDFDGDALDFLDHAVELRIARGDAGLLEGHALGLFARKTVGDLVVARQIAVNQCVAAGIAGGLAPVERGARLSEDGRGRWRAPG